MWAAVETMTYPWGPFFRIAAFTLQRREEGAAMRWSEIAPNLSVRTMSGVRMKNGKPHDVHLSRPAQAVLRALSDAQSKDRRGGEGEVCDFVFSTTGRRGHWTHGPNTCSPAIPESVSDRWTTQCWSSSARVGGPSGAVPEISNEDVMASGTL